MADAENNTIIADVKPMFDGKFQLLNGNAYMLNVSDLYVAMEAFNRDCGDIAFRVLKQEDITEEPIIFYIAVNVEGKFLLYTHDERIVNVGYINFIKVDNLYPAMEGLSRRYKDVGEFVFKITTEYF